MLAASGPGCKSASVRVARPAAAAARWRGDFSGPGRPQRPVVASVGQFSSTGTGSKAVEASPWAGLALAAMAARQRRNAGTAPRLRATEGYGEVEMAEPVDPAEMEGLIKELEAETGEEAMRSAERIAESMKLLEEYTEENHPGHQPGRFAGVGNEFEGMAYTGTRWEMLPTGEEERAAKSQALVSLSEEDRVLATKFEHEGGMGLCLQRAFQIPDRLRAEARSILRVMSGEPEEGDEDRIADSLLGSDKVDVNWNELKVNFSGDVALEELGPVEKAAILLQAGDITEEREAVMRNTWSDVEFHGGEMGNAELVSRLERQFASQLVRTAEVRLRGNAEPDEESQEAEQGSEKPAEAETSAAPPEASGPDGIFDLALKDCSEARALSQKLTAAELTATLSEPRNIGVALDLIGVYLKNYDIDKCDMVLERVVPLAKKKGGTWYIKALDKLCAVRMKQFRAWDALVALQEIERLVPFRPEEGWEFHDIMYRNFAWCYSSLDEAEKCLEYTRKSAEVKRINNQPASWFDIWDLGKAHARLGQKKKQRDEIKIGYELCKKAGEIHRKAEASDRIMLAKILSNVGEVAMGVGDSLHMDGETEEAREWYEKAEQPLREAYELHATALGPMKPLSGWQAGTVAHCMVRLERWDEVREYLEMALKVECTKDSTTNGSLIELIDRMTNCHQELDDMPGLGAYMSDLEQGIKGLRQRGWDRRERDVFALLLQRVSTTCLLGDGGGGLGISKALAFLKEAEINLQIFIGEAAQAEEEVQLDMGEDETEKLKNKKFGPQVESAGELLAQIMSSKRILEMVAQPQKPEAPTAFTEEIPEGAEEAKTISP